MTFIHYNVVCHGNDNVRLPEEFTQYHGNKYIKIIGLGLTKHQVNNIDIPYIICSSKLNRYMKQNFISENITNPSGKEFDYVTLSTTIMNGYAIQIPWDYEKFFDIEIIDCYQGIRYLYDYVVELELCMS